MNKKITALVLAFTLAFSSMPVAFADTTLPADSQAAKDLGMLVGSGSGVTNEYVNETPTRIQSAIMFLRLKGLYNTATSFTGTDNFDDAKDMTWAEGKNILAYLKANPALGFVGTGSNTFNANAKIDAASYYKVMLEALGYKQGTDFQWEDVKTFAASKGLTKVANDTNFQVADIATATIEALKAEVKGGNKTLVASLVEAGVITEQAAIAAGLVTGEVAVTSVKANSAKSFVVKFNKAVADTTKVAFEVKRDITTVAVTATWNADKTEATLTYASKLVNGDYAVKVTADSKQLAAETIKIEAEKIAEIKFLTDTVARANDYEGYVTYKVTNQYGEDITNSPLASGIDWKSSVQTIEVVRNTNKIKLTQGSLATPSLTDLRYLPTVVVTAFDNASRSFTSQTFKVSDKVAGVSEITINGIVDKDGKTVQLTAGSVDKYYLSFEAVDAFGNKVTDFDTLNNTNIFNIYSSNASVADVKVVRDAINNSKALLEVKVGAPSTVQFDMPVVFTAISYTSGKSANFTTTVKKAAVVSTFTIYAPATEVSVGETHTIPYAAFDQYGNEITAFDQINGKASISFNGTTVNPVRAANGKAEFKVTFASAGAQYLTGTVQGTAGISTASVNVRAAAIPNSLQAIAADDFSAAMVNGATQTLKTSNSSIVVKDQYDRNIALNIDNTYGGKTYTITATSDNTAAIAVSGSGDLQNAITLTAGSTVGSATITLALLEDGVEIDSTSIRVANVDKKDIVGYEIEAIDTLYANAQNTAALQSYKETVSVVGKLAGGAQVALATTDIVSFTTTNTDVFTITPAGVVTAASTNMGTATEATGKVTAVVLAANNGTVAVTADVKATKTAPTVTSMTVTAAQADRVSGIVEISGDTIKVTGAQINLGTESIFKYTTAGVANPLAPFYVSVVDNYKAENNAKLPAYVSFQNVSGTAGTLSVNANGVLAGSIAANDKFLMTVVSDNGTTITRVIEIK